MLRSSQEYESVFGRANFLRADAISRRKTRSRKEFTAESERLPTFMRRTHRSLLQRNTQRVTPERTSTSREFLPTSLSASPAPETSTLTSQSQFSRPHFKESRMCWDYFATDSDIRTLLKAKLYSPIEDGKSTRPAKTPLSRKPRALVSPMKSSLFPLIPRGKGVNFSPFRVPVVGERQRRVEDFDAERKRAGRVWTNAQEFEKFVEEKYGKMLAEMQLAGDTDLSAEELKRYFVGKCCSDVLIPSYVSSFLRLFPSDSISRSDFLSVLTIFEYTWNGFPMKRPDHLSKTFDPTNSTMVRKLCVELNELRIVYAKLVDEATGAIKSCQLEGFLVELKGRIQRNRGNTRDFFSFFDFLMAIPTIMSEF